MTRKTEFRIFIASPGDTENQRKLASMYVSEWNDTFGDDRSMVLKDWRWEKDLSPISGVDAQTEVNKKLVDNADIMIGFFWTRFGSPTKNDVSGTVEEIKIFLQLGKPIILYFIEKPVMPSGIDVHQLNEINKFKEQYRKDNIYAILNEEECLDFRAKLMIAINNCISTLIDKENPAGNSGKDTAKSNGNNKTGGQDEVETEWFKISIKDLIEQRLAELGLPLVYKRYICFYENSLLWRSYVDSRHEENIVKILNARSYAFDKKYGKYNYKKDLREKYKGEWFQPIITALQKIGLNQNSKFKVLGVGSNNGIELIQSLENFPRADIEILDLSNEAIIKGRADFPRIKFFNGNMENCTLPKSDYDLYLNLRSINSSGVDIRMTLAECFRLLKPGGLAIISVSNGYLTDNSARPGELVETKGMYDNKDGGFSNNRPYELSNKIRNKLDDYGFKQVEVHTGLTEIFLTAIR